MAFWNRMYPWSQTTATNKFIGLFFKDRPILNAVFFQTCHFELQLCFDFILTQCPSKKRHDCRVTPEGASTLQIAGLPSSKPKSLRLQDIHEDSLERLRRDNSTSCRDVHPTKSEVHPGPHSRLAGQMPVYSHSENSSVTGRIHAGRSSPVGVSKNKCGMQKCQSGVARHEEEKLTVGPHATASIVRRARYGRQDICYYLHGPKGSHIRS
jgi:hypothetical protein